MELLISRSDFLILHPIFKDEQSYFTTMSLAASWTMVTLHPFSNFIEALGKDALCLVFFSWYVSIELLARALQNDNSIKGV